MNISILVFTLFVNFSTINCVFTQKKIDFINDDGFILLKDITINNIKIEGFFILDTGSNITVLDLSLKDRTHLDVVKTVNNVDFYKNKKKVSIVNLESFAIKGFINRQDVKAIFHDLRFLNSCYPILGIIGVDLFYEEKIQIDYENSTIEFIKPDFLLENYQYKIPFVLKNGLVALDVFIRDKKFQLFLDTGSKSYINLKKSDIKFLKSGYEFHQYLNLNQSLNSKSQKINEAYVIYDGSARISNKNINYMKFSFNGKTRVLGTDFFKENALAIDLKDNMLYVKNEVQLQKSFISKYGVFFQFKNGLFVVESIRVNGKADQKGIKLGDSFSKINNLSCLKVSKCECSIKIKDVLKSNILTVEDIEGVSISID